MREAVVIESLERRDCRRVVPKLEPNLCLYYIMKPPSRQGQGVGHHARTNPQRPPAKPERLTISDLCKFVTAGVVHR